LCLYSFLKNEQPIIWLTYHPRGGLISTTLPIHDRARVTREKSHNSIGGIHQKHELRAT